MSNFLALSAYETRYVDRYTIRSFLSLYFVLSRGQISSSNTLEHNVLVELINDGLKYKVNVTKSGANSYFLVMNGSFKEIEVHRLSDGGKLMNSLVCNNVSLCTRS